jgi:two-component system alkaline phosphatase synthesis response regulator PhoP
MPKILVVADTPWVANDVHAALGLPGFEMQDHSDPRTLIDAVTTFEPDLAIIDLQVAAMGGMAMARALKESAYSSGSGELPVILLLDRSADAFLARRAAADRWLLKPFTAADLRDAVAGVWTEEPVART